MQIIRERGGLHKSELARQGKRGWGNVGHHLAVLEQQGLIELEMHGRFLWVFAKEVPREERSLIMATRVSTARRLLEAIGLRERVTVKTLAEELDISKKAIRHHLAGLRGAGVVRRNEKQPPEYFPTKPFKKERNY